MALVFWNVKRYDATFPEWSGSWNRCLWHLMPNLSAVATHNLPASEFAGRCGLAYFDFDIHRCMWLVHARTNEPLLA
jgi:hypothetical protein